MIEAQAQKDQRINGRHQRKFLLLRSLCLGLNTALGFIYIGAKAKEKAIFFVDLRRSLM